MEIENVAIIESIGAYLKSLRQQKKLSLEQVSNATRIKVRLLDEIENDIFTNLGGLGYAKAMVINYTRFLGADEEKILNLFNEKFSQKPIHVSHEKSIQPKKIMLPENIFGIILLIAVIIALTFLVIYLYNNDIITWPPFKKIESKIDVNKDIFEPDTTSVLNRLRTEPEIEPSSELNQQALLDSTDYLNDLMFKDKESPYNYEK
ncbi:MAG: helix-turn-helix domain-containing protein [Candidatus Cloacimonetes bacterium]|nr:helix-turn-helix domain-containing protein [Candidatus Cloacimonadota bacterium]MCF7814308.1 helix-turn-helix domain-containing protein [Candidatus Cloacimonadota bacterium]MCF7868385.1 helix-turn-helix domain-containing protein [Candidatus Cloacimonadota bacterium]MCF7883850.1 helix-turn-helix domain-containing protein [Candidatus Cloacimonadota bacterium]